MLTTAKSIKISHFFIGNESVDESEGNSNDSDLEALRKLSLPTNSDISSVADVIEQATKLSKHKVSYKYGIVIFCVLLLSSHHATFWNKMLILLDYLHSNSLLKQTCPVFRELSCQVYKADWNSHVKVFFCFTKASWC